MASACVGVLDSHNTTFLAQFWNLILKHTHFYLYVWIHYYKSNFRFVQIFISFNNEICQKKTISSNFNSLNKKFDFQTSKKTFVFKCYFKFEKELKSIKIYEYSLTLTLFVNSHDRQKKRG